MEKKTIISVEIRQGKGNSLVSVFSSWRWAQFQTWTHQLYSEGAKGNGTVVQSIVVENPSLPRNSGTKIIIACCSLYIG